MILYLDNLICTVDIVDEEPYFLWICCNKLFIIILLLLLYRKSFHSTF
jgi:hypothetical protein